MFAYSIVIRKLFPFVDYVTQMATGIPVQLYLDGVNDTVTSLGRVIHVKTFLGFLFMASFLCFNVYFYSVFILKKLWKNGIQNTHIIKQQTKMASSFIMQ